MNAILLLQRCGLVLAAGAMCAAAQAQPRSFDRPLTIVVGFGPGGAGDLVARKVAQALSAQIGQPVVVENKPGAGNAAGAMQVLQSRPDGYTMLLTGNGTAISAALFKSLPYSIVKDFRHVSSIAGFDLALIANGDSRFANVADVIAYAKANPGKMNIGTSRVGSTQHLAAELFKSMAGIEAVSIPYKTTGEMLAAVRSNDVQVAFEILSPILGQLASNNVKALGVTAGRRFPGLPGVPTIAESGLPGFEASSWAGVSVPAATPADMVERLSQAFRAAVATDDVQKTLQAMGYVAAGSTPQEMTTRIETDLAKWKKVIEQAHIPQQ